MVVKVMNNLGLWLARRHPEDLRMLTNHFRRLLYAIDNQRPVFEDKIMNEIISLR